MEMEQLETLNTFRRKERRVRIGSIAGSPSLIHLSLAMLFRDETVERGGYVYTGHDIGLQVLEFILSGGERSKLVEAGGIAGLVTEFAPRERLIEKTFRDYMVEGIQENLRFLEDLMTKGSPHLQLLLPVKVNGVKYDKVFKFSMLVNKVNGELSALKHGYDRNEYGVFSIYFTHESSGNIVFDIKGDRTLVGTNPKMREGSFVLYASIALFNLGITSGEIARVLESRNGVPDGTSTPNPTRRPARAR